MITTVQKGSRKKSIPQISTKALCLSFSNLLRQIKSTLTCLSSRRVIAPPSRKIAENKCHSNSCSPTDPELKTYRIITSLKVIETSRISNPQVRGSVLLMIVLTIQLINSATLKKKLMVLFRILGSSDLKVFMGQILSSLLASRSSLVFHMFRWIDFEPCLLGLIQETKVHPMRKNPSRNLNP